jgi:hypothetical protein
MYNDKLTIMVKIHEIVRKILVKKSTGKGKITFIYKLIKFLKKLFKKLIDLISEFYDYENDIRGPIPWSYTKNSASRISTIKKVLVEVPEKTSYGNLYSSIYKCSVITVVVFVTAYNWFYGKES